MTRFRISFLFTALLACAACGNSTGSTTASTDDAATSDLQISGTDAVGTDAISDATSDIANGTDAISDAAPDIASGTDAVTADTSPDVPISTCAPTYEGSIPGAQFDLSKTPCAFSISAANGVFNLGYKLTVASAAKLSIGGDLGGCLPQASSIHGGIATFEQVGGNSQKWCVCDTGLCAPVKPPFTASTPGSYDVAFIWDGMNWYGPSDTGNKPGPAFPVGSYTFSVSVSGEHQLPDGTTETFAAVAKLPITLTP